jgi:hypothetical protein
MKCTSRAAAVARYGGIDFASRHWPHQSQWLEIFQVPTGWFPSWHVVGTTHPVEHIALNKDLHTPLLNALTAVHNKGLGGLLLTFDGCFNIRMVRGSAASPSTHSYGLALDINADSNPLAATKGGFYNHPDFVKCFTDQGFDWGGHWVHRKDPMHFSYAWE